jgi:CSLREA domain-containing protein
MNKKHFLLIPLIGIMVGISYLSYSFINHAQAAGPISVNSNLDTVADDGFCTLREAIENANDTVTGDPHGFVISNLISSAFSLQIKGSGQGKTWVLLALK